MYWNPPQELNRVEQLIVKRTRKRRKFFVFVREHRHHIIDKEFQQELIDTYTETPNGTEPKPPGLLCMAILLQAYCNVGDQEAVECSVMDRRWQMVLDCLDCQNPPFSQGTLVNIRNRMIAHGLDKKLLDRTVAVAEEYGGFSPRQLRAALDSSPLFGAGRVEDTFNLLGHAMAKAVKVIAKQRKEKPREVIEQAELLLVGQSSIKAALDLNWAEKDAKLEALQKLIEEFDRWKSWLVQEKESTENNPELKKAMDVVEQILSQDTEVVLKDGSPVRQLTKGVAKDRRISVEDEEIRHGRKNKNNRIDGYKKHLLGDLDSRVIREVVVRPANEPEFEAIDHFGSTLEPELGLAELAIDLGYMGHEKIHQWEESGVNIVARPWAQKNGGLFTKDDFEMDFDNMVLKCPAGEEVEMKLGKVIEFPASACDICKLRGQCTTAKKGAYRGRGVRVRKDEKSQAERRAKMKTPEGRAAIRERVMIEHRISHHVARQGRQARYLGTRKNQYDGRRHAAVINLQLAAQYHEQAQASQSSHPQM